MIDTEVINVTIDRSLHTVLVVDDNAATRYSTGRVLRAAGFGVVEAASGMEAIVRSERGVSGVVLDVHLPDLDGFEVCRLIRARPSTQLLPVVHLSATHVMSEDKVAGLNAGADAYLIHPVEPAVLIATMQALIRARTAEDNMRRSEQRLRAIYDQAQSGIGLLDERGCLVDANPAMATLLGRAPVELLDVPLSALAPPDWEDRVAARLSALSQQDGNEPWHGEFPLRARDGRPVHLEWSISAPIEDGLRVAIAIDASERHELEERTRDVLEREQAARSIAEQHSRTKDDFIAVLSHELRNPLNSIVGWVAVLTRRNPTPEAMKGLQAIDRAVKTQARIISDILDVSRINSGKLRLVKEQVNPAEVAGSALASLRTAIQERAITVEHDIASAGQPAWLDPSRFQQVFWNLMTNAIKFSKQGGTVRVDLHRRGDRLVLTVQDFGQGIKPEFIPHLFDRFSQSDSPGNRLHSGLGLGLSIVKQLVELHGGHVHAASDGPGLGTTMRVDIPVTPLAGDIPADAEDAGAAMADLDGPAGARPLQGLNILVVEDDAGASEMMAMVLSDRGAHVRTAADFTQAVHEASRLWPDVVVSDIGLPGQDGYELIRHIRSMEATRTRGGRLAAVALTAFARPEDLAKALAAGFNAHIAKPLKPHALVAAILGVNGAART